MKFTVWNASQSHAKPNIKKDEIGRWTKYLPT